MVDEEEVQFLSKSRILILEAGLSVVKELLCSVIVVNHNLLILSYRVDKILAPHRYLLIFPHLQNVDDLPQVKTAGFDKLSQLLIWN